MLRRSSMTLHLGLRCAHTYRKLNVADDPAVRLLYYSSMESDDPTPSQGRSDAPCIVLLWVSMNAVHAADDFTYLRAIRRKSSIFATLSRFDGFPQETTVEHSKYFVFRPTHRCQRDKDPHHTHRGTSDVDGSFLLPRMSPFFSTCKQETNRSIP